MWIEQNGVLMELPDDLPMPPNSRAVKVPEGFASNPQNFRFEKGKLVRAPQPKREQAPRFTDEEIVQMKDALQRGLFKAVAETPERRRTKKEDK